MQLRDCLLHTGRRGDAPLLDGVDGVHAVSEQVATPPASLPVVLEGLLLTFPAEVSDSRPLTLLSICHIFSSFIGICNLVIHFIICDGFSSPLRVIGQVLHLSILSVCYWLLSRRLFRR